MSSKVQLQADFAIPNTLALTSLAQWGCDIVAVQQLQGLRRHCSSNNMPFNAVGEGSNIVAQPWVAGCVGVMKIAGIKVLEESAEHIVVRVGAGENWHKFVEHCLNSGWFGLENLALIPGSVGAAPVQNIGAYGVEIAEHIDHIEVVDAQGRRATLSPERCGFTYRSSIFRAQPELTITAVTLRLSKSARVNIEYPDVQRWLQEAQLKNPSPAEVAAAVIAIRSSKLPDPQQVPNVGSFFKNPLVPLPLATALARRYAQLQQFPWPPGSTALVKLSAAQLIDLAGCKGLQDGPLVCWAQQPLVLVNRDRGGYAEVLSFADEVRARVAAMFDVQLELEPSLLA